LLPNLDYTVKAICAVSAQDEIAIGETAAKIPIFMINITDNPRRLAAFGRASGPACL
jgi:hypothetical protein